MYKEASREGRAAGLRLGSQGQGPCVFGEVIEKTSSGVFETLGLGDGWYFSVGQG